MTRIVVILSALGVIAAGVVAGIFLFGQKERVHAVATSGVSSASGGGASGSGLILRREGPGGSVETFDPVTAMEPDELLVANPPSDFTDILRQLNFTLIERFTFQGLAFQVARVKVAPGMALPAARAALAGRMPGVLIDYNHRFDDSAGPDVPSKVTSYAQEAIGWHDVPASCGKGLKIGMIDSSVDESHPVFRGRDLEFRTFHSPNRQPGSDDHGTAIAALLVGRPGLNGLGGLLPGATLKAANMFEKSESGFEVGNAVAMLRALDWLVREKVAVINMSVAGNKNLMVERGIRKATEAGVVIVAAAGNWGRDDMPAYPAAFEQVIGVTAVDAEDGIYEKANRGNYIKFAAPGVTMMTAAPGGGSRQQSGTSFAVPFLTAIVGLAIKNGEGSSSATVEKAITRVSLDLGPKGKDPTFGWGLPQMQPKC